MATTKDGRGGLEDSPFSYKKNSDGKVFIAWRGRQVLVLKGDKAQSFLKRVAGLNESRQQIAMAKITGNFKRGNER